MIVAFFLIAVLSIIFWVPIMLRFYKAWTNRNNPVSLAICAMIALIVWSTIAQVWALTDDIEPVQIILVVTVMSAVVGLYSHLAFYWSKKRFPDARSQANSASKADEV